MAHALLILARKVLFVPARIWRRLWREYDRGVHLIPKSDPAGRLLEIGCATGTQLVLLRHAGWRDVQGMELSEKAAAIASNRGLTVFSGSVEDGLDRCDPSSFDVIIASMVLEHLQNPFEVLEKILQKLKTGGELLLSTVVIHSIDYYMFNTPYWAGWDLPRHMVFFSKRDLVSLLGPHFDRVDFFYQVAPQDYTRPAAVRLRGQGRWLDRVILALGESGMRPFCWLTVLLGLACRVSIRCRGKRNHAAGARRGAVA
ncbi:MAG: class I SAM-dependent methyltransferase [Nitrospirota bacterium]